MDSGPPGLTDIDQASNALSDSGGIALQVKSETSIARLLATPGVLYLEDPGDAKPVEILAETPTAIAPKPLKKGKAKKETRKNAPPPGEPLWRLVKPSPVGQIPLPSKVLRPRIWSSSRRALNAILPELGKAVNNIACRGYTGDNIPVLVLEGGAVWDRTGTKAGINVTVHLVQDFTCVTEVLVGTESSTIEGEKERPEPLRLGDVDQPTSVLEAVTIVLPKSKPSPGRSRKGEVQTELQGGKSKAARPRGGFDNEGDVFDVDAPSADPHSMKVEALSSDYSVPQPRSSVTSKDSKILDLRKLHFKKIKADPGGGVPQAPCLSEILQSEKTTVAESQSEGQLIKSTSGSVGISGPRMSSPNHFNPAPTSTKLGSRTSHPHSAWNVNSHRGHDPNYAHNVTTNITRSEGVYPRNKRSHVHNDNFSQAALPYPQMHEQERRSIRQSHSAWHAKNNWSHRGGHQHPNGPQDRSCEVRGSQNLPNYSLNVQGGLATHNRSRGWNQSRSSGPHVPQEASQYPTVPYDATRGWSHTPGGARGQHRGAGYRRNYLRRESYHGPTMRGGRPNFRGSQNRHQHRPVEMSGARPASHAPHPSQPAISHTNYCSQAANPAWDVSSRHPRIATKFERPPDGWYAGSDSAKPSLGFPDDISRHQSNVVSVDSHSDFPEAHTIIFSNETDVSRNCNTSSPASCISPAFFRSDIDHEPSSTSCTTPCSSLTPGKMVRHSVERVHSLANTEADPPSLQADGRRSDASLSSMNTSNSNSEIDKLKEALRIGFDAVSRLGDSVGLGWTNPPEAKTKELELDINSLFGLDRDGSAQAENDADGSNDGNAAGLSCCMPPTETERELKAQYGDIKSGANSSNADTPYPARPEVSLPPNKRPSAPTTSSSLSPSKKRRTNGIPSTKALERTMRMFTSEEAADCSNERMLDQFIPAKPPAEIQSVLDAFQDGKPVILISSRDALPHAVPEECAYSHLGLFLICSFKCQRIIPTPSKIQPPPEGFVSGRVEWTFDFSWVPGGEVFLQDPGQPWWMESKPEPIQDLTTMYYSLLPFHLLGKPSVADESGWFCEECGLLNEQIHMRHRKCLSMRCKDSPAQLGYAVHLEGAREPQQGQPIDVPMDAHPLDTIHNVSNWDDGMQTYIYGKAGATVKHVYTRNREELQYEATMLFEDIQKNVELLKEGNGFGYDVGGSVTWSEAPGCVSQSRDLMLHCTKYYGEEDDPKIEYMKVQSWNSSASKKGVRISARDALIMMCLGADIQFNLIPLSGFEAQSSGRTTGPLLVTLVHGDLLLLSGDDFDASIKRTGMSIFLTGTHTHIKREGRSY